MEDTHDPAAAAAHDILAAEAFAVGAGDPALHREAAHDVLAADQFPLPAAKPHAVPPEWQRGGAPGAQPVAPARQPSRQRRIGSVALLAAAIVLLAVRRRRRARA